MSTFQERVGHCYQLAATFVIGHPDTLLVHGSIFNEEFAPVPNDHAWVETVTGEVYDAVLQQWIPPAYWRRHFGPKRYRIYNAEEAARLLLTNDHYGPWHEGEGGIDAADEEQTA